MTVLTTAQAVMIGVVLALWLAGSGWALVSGLQMRARAREAEAEATRLRTLLATAPTLPMTVGVDGQIDAPARLAEWLGLARLPRFVRDLTAPDTGLSEEDAARLTRGIATAQKTARGFSFGTRAQGSQRTLVLSGTPAPVGLEASAVVWVHDASEAQAEADRQTAEAARLRRAFETISHLIEAAPVPMWHRGPDLKLTLVNAAYVKAVDAKDADDAIARNLELVENSGGGPVASAAAARNAREVRERIVPATIGGQRRSLRVVDVPLGEAGVAGYALDNDEIERARAAFGRFVESQRDMLDRLSAGVAQFAQDRTLSFSNAPFQRMFGVEASWLLDRPEFDRVLERMRDARRVPEMRDFPAWKTERQHWFTNPDGATEESWLLPGGQHLRVVAQPTPDGGLTVFFEDRTEQVQLASARDTLLRVREATFDNLFEAVGVFSADGRLNVWNNRFRELWGLEDELLITHPHIDKLTEAVAPVLSKTQQAVLIRELVRGATLDRKAHSGRIGFRNGKHYEFAAVPLPDGNALFTMLDITDSRRIERALRERATALASADKVKTAFVANMSYELRTPLTSIGGFAEMLDKGYAGELSEAGHDYVRAIVESVGKLGTLVDDVLHMTQSDAELAHGERETADLVALLGALVDERAEAAAARKVELVRDIGADTGRLGGDTRAIKAALGALLDAMMADAPDGGRVLLHARGGEQGVLIVISDNGSGRTTARAEFDAARRVIEAAGGSFTAHAEAGAGSLVQIELPR